MTCFKERGWNVLGVDPANSVAEVAKKKGIKTHIGLFGSKNINEKISSKKFDVITAFNVFEVGASLTGLTSIVTVAASEVNNPSVTVYVNEVIPLKFNPGVNVTVLPSSKALPSKET